MHTLIANLQHAARNRERVDIGGGIFTPDDITEALTQHSDTLADLLEALLIALPFVEDHEQSDIYKTGAVSRALRIIRAAIKQAEAMQ
jgi:hypothetical protein